MQWHTQCTRNPPCVSLSLSVPVPTLTSFPPAPSCLLGVCVASSVAVRQTLSPNKLASKHVACMNTQGLHTMSCDTSGRFLHNCAVIRPGAPRCAAVSQSSARHTYQQRPPWLRFKGLWGLGAVAKKLAKKSLESTFDDMPGIIEKWVQRESPGCLAGKGCRSMPFLSALASQGECTAVWPPVPRSAAGQHCVSAPPPSFGAWLTGCFYVPAQPAGGCRCARSCCRRRMGGSG